MTRFLKALAGGIVLVGAVLAVAPAATARPAALIIGLAWIPACLLMARRDRRQQAEKAGARQPSGRF